jgi:hypothetical protein
MACPVKTEAMDEEMESEMGRWEVPKEDAILKPVEGWKKRQRGWHLAAECRQKLKDGSCRKLGAPHRRTTRHAKVAWCKRGIVRKDCIRFKVG